MRPFLGAHFGNPSSGHGASIGANAALETARGHVAALLGCHIDEVVFTSGGSEANNLALKGVFFKLREKGDHIITTRIEHGILFHADAAQSVGKIPTDVNQLGVDLLSITGHEVYAPKGIGALFVRRGVSLEPLIHGAGHESGRRPGTESALLAVGIGKACELARDLSGMDRVRTLRDHFWMELQKGFGSRVVLNGHPVHRLPNTLNVSFVGRIGAEIFARLDGVAPTTGSACHSGRVELSPVLQAMGIETDAGMGAIRFSLGRATTHVEIDTVVAQLADILAAPG